MDKTLAVLVKEQDYAEEIVSFLGTKKEIGFRVIAFLEADRFLEYERENYIDYLLCDEDTVAELQHEIHAGYICVLTEYSCVGEKGGYPAIFKYQSAEALFRDIMRNYYGAIPVEHRTDDKGVLIMCISSPVGGAYKSTFALSLALERAGKDRTLFISFDPFFTVPGEIKSVQEKNLTDIIYFAEKQSEGLGGFIEKAAKRCGKVEYISGVSHWYDIYDVSSQIARRIMTVLRGQNTYRYVVIDVGTMGVASMELLSECDRAYVPVNKHDERAAQSYSEWLRQIKFASGDFKMNKLIPVTIPTDDTLVDKAYTVDMLMSGALGAYVKRLEEDFYSNTGAKEYTS